MSDEASTRLREHRLPDHRLRRPRERAARPLAGAPSRAEVEGARAAREAQRGGELWLFDGGKERWPVGLTATAGLSYFQYQPLWAAPTRPCGPAASTPKPASRGPRRRRHLRPGALSERHPQGRAGLLRRPRAPARLRARLQRVAARVLRGFAEAGSIALRPCIPTTGRRRHVGRARVGAWRTRPSRRGDLSPPSRTGLPGPEAGRRSLLGAVAQERGDARSRSTSAASCAAASSPEAKRRAARTGTRLRFVGKAALDEGRAADPGRRLRRALLGHLRALPRTLKIVLVEANIGWIPTLLEQADDMFRRYRWYTGAVEQEMSEMPSRDLLPELLGHLHDRHGRYAAAQSPERGSHLIWSDRLPPQRLRLAPQPRDDRARLPRHRQVPRQADAPHQLQGPLLPRLAVGNLASRGIRDAGIR